MTITVTTAEVKQAIAAYINKNIPELSYVIQADDVKLHIDEDMSGGRLAKTISYQFSKATATTGEINGDKT